MRTVKPVKRERGYKNSRKLYKKCLTNILNEYIIVKKQGDTQMQETIKNSGLTISQFAEHYGIPYNTVYQWANGERNAPKWVKTFIERLNKLQTKGNQLEIPKKTDGFVYEYYQDKQLKYRAFMLNEKTEEKVDWFNRCQSKYQHGDDGLNRKVIYVIEKIMDTAEKNK